MDKQVFMNYQLIRTVAFSKTCLSVLVKILIWQGLKPVYQAHKQMFLFRFLKVRKEGIYLYLFIFIFVYTIGNLKWLHYTG